MAIAGPKKPKKPKSKPVKLVNGDYAWIDAEATFSEGVEIFACTQEDTYNYEPLDNGTYTLDSGIEFVVVDGFVDSIG